MVTQEDVNALTLRGIWKRMTEVFPDQINTCLTSLTDEQLWWTPNEHSNSVGTLVLHISGALRHYVAHRIGGIEFVRDRPREFTQRGLSRVELQALFRDAVKECDQTFARFDPVRFSEPSTEPEFYTILLEDLLGALVHMTVHTGQIVYVTKMLSAGPAQELWRTSYRSHGMWKK
jgi:Protein of unknown function (DUF1572)